MILNTNSPHTFPYISYNNKYTNFKTIADQFLFNLMTRMIDFVLILWGDADANQNKLNFNSRKKLLFRSESRFKVLGARGLRQGLLSNVTYPWQQVDVTPFGTEYSCYFRIGQKQSENSRILLPGFDEKKLKENELVYPAV